MSETILGKLEVKTSNGRGTAVVLNGDAIPQSGFVVGDPQGQLGGNPQPKEPSFITGQLDLKDEKGNVVMSFGLGPVNIGQSSGVIDLMGLEGESNLHLNGNGIISVSGAAQILLGEKPQGLLANAKPPIALNAIERTLVLTNAFGATVSLAAGNAGGEIRIPGGLHATNSTLRLGAGVDGDGGSGVFFLCNSEGIPVLSLKAEGSEVISIPGMLRLDNNGSMRLGGEPDGGGKDGILLFRNAAGKETMRLDGKAGDLIFQNADCAEDFDIAADETIAAGTVMVLGDDGRLLPSSGAYDKRVAGVVSGAGDYRPGIILDRQQGESARQPIALMGKVFCKVDARESPIVVGDLLTTSATPGHAMRAGDPKRAFGAVLGKALKPLAEGLGIIPVLVSLQ